MLMAGERRLLSPVSGVEVILMDALQTGTLGGDTTKKMVAGDASPLGGGMPLPKNNKKPLAKARRGEGARSRKQNLYDLTEALNALINAINVAGESEGVAVVAVTDHMGKARRVFGGMYTCPNCGRLVLNVLGVTHEAKCIERKKNGATR